MRLALATALAAAPLFARAGLLSEFSCMRPRAVDSGTWHNVSLAAGLVNGSVLPPGGEFSFLKAIRGGSGKFLPGNSFLAGRIVKSTGGGYCQVSTAIYNAVLLAGLRVTERYPHSFYDEEDAYVPPGQDAAVSGSSHADFKFLNTSAYPVTLRASALDGRVSVQLFGAAEPRKRWLSTEATRSPMSHLKKEGLRPRPGHDGWRVRRTLNTLDAAGNTRPASLGVDEYEMVPAYD
jgi:hypothetical protein